jgi:NAD(P)H-dependent flavin oxidoreductase YrpB (nitropropane dioxygenase family)
VLPTRFTSLVGCRLPLQQAGMGGVATPALAAAVTGAGGLGMVGFADAALVPPGCGVNFLLPFLERDALEVAAERATVVEFFWGEPDPALVALAGDLVAWQVGSAEEARAAVGAGCHLVVAQGVEAGGHVRGTVGLLPLLDAVLGAVGDVVPVVAAGGIGTAAAVRAALAAGADGVRVGTRFVAAAESAAHPRYVEALCQAGPEDTVLTTTFSVLWPEAPHRVLASCLGDGAERPPMPPLASMEGDVQSMAMYAGQSVGAVQRRQAAAEIVAELMPDWLSE